MPTNKDSQRLTPPAHAVLGRRPIDLSISYIDELRSRFNSELTLLRIDSLTASSSEPRKPYEVVDGVAIININGVLSNDPFWWDETSYKEIKSEVSQAASDADVNSILLNINSPGGETTGAFELADFLSTAAKKKRMWAVASPIAYSAAYLIASQASRIFVPPQTGGVGSIGVFSVHRDISKALDEMGINITIISAGEGKVDGNPWQPLSKTAKESLRAEVDRLYGLFTSAVARGRGMTEEKVVGLGAHLYRGGSQAIAAGLADQVGDLEDAWMGLVMAGEEEAKKKQGSYKFLGNTFTDTKATPVVGDVATASAAGHDQPTTNNHNHSDKETTMSTQTGTADATAQNASPPANNQKTFTQAEMEALVTSAVSAAIAKLQPAPTTAPAASTAATTTTDGAADPLEVVALCRLAGKPAMANDFITNRASIAKVREQLTAAQATDDPAAQIDSHVDVRTKSPNGSGNGSGSNTSMGVGGSHLIAACERMAAVSKGGR